MNARCLVLMCGLPAAGKTTIESRLHAHLGGALIRSCDVFVLLRSSYSWPLWPAGPRATRGCCRWSLRTARDIASRTPIFRVVVSADESVRVLPVDELAYVLGAANREDLFVGVGAAPADAAVVLYRGNLEPVIVPLMWFRTRPGGPKPDAADLGITDSSQTVRLGEYEAAADAILYEFDAAYRRRAKKREVERDDSFGGALRRLRPQKGLHRSDFDGITAKEIARIERGEVRRLHPRTVAILAKRLGVSAREIPTY